MSSEATSDQKDYEVGYGRPPKSGQFQKGQSGNPGGSSKSVRARKAKKATFGDLFSEGMQRPIEVEENGKTVILTRMHLAVRRRVEDAAKGKMRALKELLKLRELKDTGPLAPAKPLVFSLDLVSAAGALGYTLYQPNVVVIREPNPSAAGRPVKRESHADEPKLPRRSIRELIELEFERQVQVSDAVIGATKRMKMREVIAEQIMRLFVAGKPGAADLLMMMNEQPDVDVSEARKIYVSVPWDYEMPPKCDVNGRPYAADN